MKIGHVRWSCFYRDNHISPGDLMAYALPHALTMSKISSGSQHRLTKSRKAALINDDVIVYALAHHHYTCNDTARHRLQTGPGLHLGTCLSCVFHYGWFLTSSASLEILVHVCRQRHTAAEEPREKHQRRCSWS